ncbi:nucleolar complex protein 2, partial [Tremellales sp. Uapishka_1]
MAKATKQTKKFASSGKLKETIKVRRQHQQVKRKAEDRTARRQKQRGAPRDDHAHVEEDDESGDEEREAKKLNAGTGGRAGGVAKNVDELFGQGGLDVPVDEESEFEELSEEDEEESEEEVQEGDEMELNEEEMKKAMKELEKKDPEFFKYLKENDNDLLEFGKANRIAQDEDEAMSEDEEEEEDEQEEEGEEKKKTSVSMKMLRQWQEGMLKQHSLRSLKKCLTAFRAAAHMNEEENEQGTGSDTKYTIDSAQVFNKLVLTALKFTPVVVGHHLPYRTLANGRIKLQAAKTTTNLPKIVLSHFSTLLHLIKSLPSIPSSIKSGDEAGSLLLVAVSESTKLLPWILGARKHLRAYLKVLLELWATANDNVRIAAFLAVRKVFEGGDDAVKDMCLKNIYRALLPPLRLTTPHTLPSLNLMKNTAATLFQLAPQLSYQHAFTFIRMLAVHLRTVVRSSTSGQAGENQEAFKAVYNWQFVHCIDFWSMVLSGAAAKDIEIDNNGLESPLKPLIYPLVQISLGVVRLLPSSRYFPLRYHILHSLIRIIAKTKIYVPLSPFLLEILDSAEFRRSNPKKSTLKPLDLEYIVRAPAAYPKTRIYQESLGEELVFLLGEYHAEISTNIAFPEMVLPIILTLRRHLKKGTAGSPKVQNGLKGLVEKLEASRKWIEEKRANVGFSPRDKSELEKFELGLEKAKTPLGVWMALQRKVREKRRIEIERAIREEVDEDEEEDEEQSEDDEDEEMDEDSE